MIYRDFKDLTRRMVSYKILHDKAFNIAKNPKYDGYQRRLVSKVYKFFDKKTSAARGNEFAVGAIKNEITSNKNLAKELHKLIIKKFEKTKVQVSLFIDNIWGADLVNVQLISKFDKGCRFL